MPLSSELVSQFAKLASNKPKEEKESTTYGTTVIQNGNKYVKLDGSELLTPASFTTNIANGERVTVLIKNHMAIVTGNITSPAARTSEVEEVGDKVDAAEAAVKNLKAENATITGKLNAAEGNISNLKAENATITGKLEATEGIINNLDTTYANIDFANVGVANIKEFYAKYGVVKDIIIKDEKITGKLVGVTIVGDLIEGGTVKAEKLVVRGKDGLFYKLNTDGVSITAEQTNENSLHGSIITAKSIVASQISVSDLVAFGATIGGFHISDSSIYSGYKNAVDSPERGIYLDSEGQLVVGDGTNYFKYYKDENDENGDYILDISSVSHLQDDINNVNADITNQKTDIINNSKEFTINALTEYTKTSDFGDYKEDTESRFKVMSENIEMNFTTVNKSIDDANSNTNDRFNKLEKYIRFDENGITIGESGNKLKLVLDNDNITFTKNDQPIGWWDGENFHTGNIVVEVNERAQFGNFAYVPRSDGSIMFLKVSGKES